MGIKSIQVPEEFHAYVKANKREGETMGEALVRLAGGPHPSAVAGSLSDETAAGIRDAIEARGGTTSREDVSELFEGGDDS